MIVQRQPNESPSEPDFDVADVLIEGLPGWTQACNFRVDPDDDTRVRFEYSNGTPVRVRRDAIIATRGRVPASPLAELDRAALNRLTASGGEAGAGLPATWSPMRSDESEADSTIPPAGAQPAAPETSEEPF